ncbi:ATP-binding protein [Bacillus ndiopicus]|uniref:ATP-binding protein n=1 Tax=Bacillus ndiopicus TaxID=1347368 RepID=UPI0005A69361|nr:ATP-binding protein [Bacillus ndiopicus]
MIVCYTIIFLYLITITIKTPVIDVSVERVQHQLIIKDFTYTDWAARYNIERGDIVLEVNQQQIMDDITKIKGVSSILIQNAQGDKKFIEITYSDFKPQLLYFILIPLLYYIMCLIVCIYLYFNRKDSFHSFMVFTLFILTTALEFGSIGATAHLSSVGMFISSIGGVVILILLLHFLLNYLRHLNIEHALIIKPIYLYGFLIISCMLMLLEKVVPAIYQWNTQFLLIIMLVLTAYTLFILLVTYIKTKKKQLLALLLCLVGPLIPMLLFYALPLLLFNQYIFSALSCFLVLLLIPILLLVTQLPDYLFDIDYEISKIRYYSILSLVASSVVAISLYFMLDIQQLDVFKSFLLLFIVIFAMLYLKERIDYASRKILYSPKGDYVHFVYKTIEHIKNMPSVDKLLKRFSEALAQQLSVSHVEVHIYSASDGAQEIVASPKIIESLKLGTVKKVERRYIGCLHETLDKKYIVTIENDGGIYLNKEELLSLELLLMYVSNFIDNTQFVERLIEQLDMSQQGSPAWLKKFVWIQLENEKAQLAQELHDTILQQQLYLIRELDIAQMDIQLIERHREYLIQLNADLRQYCEQLKPPLLDKQGLHVALNKLFIEVEEQADFIIIHEIEEVVLDSLELPLLIYRTIQEMLNNALKHAEATYVKITLTNTSQGFELVYFDNGIGCDLSEVGLKNSMGLQGMKERVYAYNGLIELTSAPDEGMHIRIKIEE